MVEGVEEVVVEECMLEQELDISSCNDVSILVVGD